MQQRRKDKMLIRTQDGKTLVNFDNVTRIFVVNKRLVAEMVSKENLTTISQYDSEEEAERNLEEIIESYRHYNDRRISK